MSLPQNLEPPVEPVVADEEEVSSAPDATTVDEEETPEEIASDAALRTWAKDNGIEGVPASGKLSAAWRDEISAAMATTLNDVAVALDPKEEDSAEDTSSDLSTPAETETTDDSTDQSNLDSTDEESPEPVPVAPEFETGTYRSVFKAPDTFVSSQAFTA